MTIFLCIPQHMCSRPSWKGLSSEWGGEKLAWTCFSPTFSATYTNAHAEREKEVYMHKKETDRSKILTASSNDTVYLCIGLLLWKYITPSSPSNVGRANTVLLLPTGLKTDSIKLFLYTLGPWGVIGHANWWSLTSCWRWILVINIGRMCCFFPRSYTEINCTETHFSNNSTLVPQD